MLNQRGRSISARRATGAEEAESEHPENEMKNAPAVVTGAMLYPTEKCTKTATCTTKLYMQMFLFDPFRFSLKIVLYIASLFMGRVSKMSVLFSLSFDSSLFFCVFFHLFIESFVVVDVGRCRRRCRRRCRVLLHASQVTWQKTEAVKGGSERPDRIREPYRQTKTINRHLTDSLYSRPCIYTAEQLFVILSLSLAQSLPATNQFSFNGFECAKKELTPRLVNPIQVVVVRVLPPSTVCALKKARYEFDLGQRSQRLHYKIDIKQRAFNPTLLRQSMGKSWR